LTKSFLDKHEIFAAQQE